MNRDIAFPNLGIYLNNVGHGFRLFGFEVTYYGLIIGIGIALGFVIGVREARRTGQNPEHYLDMGIVGVIISILCARIYYVIFTWDYYSHNLLSIINMREGGLAIYGGIIGAFGTMIVYSKMRKLNAPQIFDVVSFGLINGQMLGRWGNFFNREAFGEYTDSLFAMRLPVNAVRSGDITQLMRDHEYAIEGVRYIQVHPTFLYESLWCFGLLILMFLIRKHKKYEGQIALIYASGYGLGRLWIEALRTDQLLLPVIQLPVSQVIAGITVLGAGGVLLWNHIRKYQYILDKSRIKTSDE